MTLRVDRKKVVEEWGLPSSPNIDDVEVIEEKIVDTSRWSIIYELIVRIGNKFYKTYYSVGATECQDESPWEHESEVVFNEVHQVEKIVKDWELVP